MRAEVENLTFPTKLIVGILRFWKLAEDDGTQEERQLTLEEGDIKKYSRVSVLYPP